MDRRFVHSDTDLFFHRTTDESAYGLFWDGLVAEAVGRMAEAEDYYRAALDPERQAHPGSVWQYNSSPLTLEEAELEAFGSALCALARFRLGALLMHSGHVNEAGDVLNQGDGAFEGLLETIRMASTRDEGCQIATDWAAADMDFLPALNRGGIIWQPEVLCTHPPIEDSLAK